MYHILSSRFVLLKICISANLSLLTCDFPLLEGVRGRRYKDHGNLAIYSAMPPYGLVEYQYSLLDATAYHRGSVHASHSAARVCFSAFLRIFFFVLLRIIYCTESVDSLNIWIKPI